jgi:hypothetical protein
VLGERADARQATACLKEFRPFSDVIRQRPTRHLVPSKNLATAIHAACGSPVLSPRRCASFFPSLDDYPLVDDGHIVDLTFSISFLGRFLPLVAIEP